MFNRFRLYTFRDINHETIVVLMRGEKYFINFGNEIKRIAMPSNNFYIWKMNFKQKAFCWNSYVDDDPKYYDRNLITHFHTKIQQQCNRWRINYGTSLLVSHILWAMLNNIAFLLTKHLFILALRSLKHLNSVKL